MKTSCQHKPEIARLITAMLKFFLSLLVCCFCSNALALDNAIQLGVGMTSFTSGRTIPALYVGYESSSYAFDASSTGYRTRYDYLAGYTASGFYVFDIGEFWGASTRCGLGAGAYYERHGYRDSTTSDTIRTTTDFGLGPAFRVGIYPFGHLFLNLETILAVGHPNNFLLLFQDVSVLSVGVSW